MVGKVGRSRHQLTPQHSYSAPTTQLQQSACYLFPTIIELCFSNSYFSRLYGKVYVSSIGIPQEIFQQLLQLLQQLQFQQQIMGLKGGTSGLLSLLVSLHICVQQNIV